MIGAPFLALVFVAFLAIVGAGCLTVAAYDALEAWHHDRTEAQA